MVALGQTYFAIQTRKQEITEQEYDSLSDDEKWQQVVAIWRRNKFIFECRRMWIVIWICIKKEKIMKMKKIYQKFQFHGKCGVMKKHY